MAALSVFAEKSDFIHKKLPSGQIIFFFVLLTGLIFYYKVFFENYTPHFTFWSSFVAAFAVFAEKNDFIHKKLPSGQIILNLLESPGSTLHQ